MSILVQERNFDLFSQFQLSGRVVLSDPASIEQSPINKHITSDGIITESYFSPYSSMLHACLREDVSPFYFISDGITAEYLLKITFPYPKNIEKIHIYPYASQGYATNGIIQSSINGVDWFDHGSYSGIGMSNVNNFIEVSIGKYVNYIKIVPTETTGSRMELKLFKVFADPKIMLDAANFTDAYKTPKIDETNFEKIPQVKISGNLQLNESSAVVSNVSVTHDYSELTENNSVGLHAFNLKAQLLNVNSCVITSESILSSVINEGKVLKEFPLNTLKISSTDVLEDLSHEQIDQTLGNTALKITGKIKVEIENDYLFW